MSWKRHPIEDLLQRQSNKRFIQQGWSPKCHTRPAAPGEWGVLKTTAIQPGRFEPEHNKALPNALDPRSNIEVTAGDLLITCAGPRSRCGIPALVRRTPKRLMMSGKMYRLRPGERIDARFLELYLLSPDAQQRIDEMKTGISDSGLNLTHDRFVQLSVPVPPLDEQRHIVGVLEAHLADLDAAENALADAQRKSAALESAWLTRSMRSASIRTTVGAVLESARGGWSRSRDHLVPPNKGIPYLKMYNILARGGLDMSDVVYVDATAAEHVKYGVALGDVLFNSKNSADLVGKTALADARAVGAVINENIMRLRFDDRVEPAFAVLWFRSPEIRRRIKDATSASTNVAAVYQKDLLRFPMWLPDREHQEHLVAEFSELREGTAAVEAASSRMRARSMSLRNALLKAAFSG